VVQYYTSFLKYMPKYSTYKMVAVKVIILLHFTLAAENVIFITKYSNLRWCGFLIRLRNVSIVG
jgi:hypothetical protein